MKLSGLFDCAPPPADSFWRRSSPLRRPGRSSRDGRSGVAKPLPIAIPDFAAGNAGDAAVAQNIAKVVRADLDRSGLFQPLDPKSFIEKLANINAPPQFGS